MTTDPLLPAELLDILDHAHLSPLWPAILEGLQAVARQAEVFGWRSDQADKAATAMHDAIRYALGEGHCCACLQDTTAKNVICDRCKAELL